MIIHDGFDNDLGERAMRQAGIGDSDHHEDDNDHEKENFRLVHPYQCQKQ